MRLHQLEKVIKHKKRIGRGLGSGKGKTGGRGQKGQKARGKMSASFIGGSLPLYKKLPFRRGLKNRKVSPKSEVVSLDDLNKFKPNSTVDLNSLVERGIVAKGAKVLAKGKLEVALKVKLPTSMAAKAAIEKKGGSVV